MKLLLTLSAAAAAAAAALLCACGGPSGPAVQTLSGPAPAGALACVIRSLSERGYSAVSGGTNDGFVRFERRYTHVSTGVFSVGETTPARVEITAVEAPGQLQMSVVNVYDTGTRVRASEATMRDAEAVQSQCGTHS